MIVCNCSVELNMQCIFKYLNKILNYTQMWDVYIHIPG